ncbi:hypothetical protein D3C87_2158490 [compost metagenome]
MIPELVRSYRLESLDDAGNWVTVLSEQNNRKRRRVHLLEAALETRAVRVVVTATNGSPYAEIIEVRAYA